VEITREIKRTSRKEERDTERERREVKGATEKRDD
jgi:hypothetical protein